MHTSAAVSAVDDFPPRLETTADTHNTLHQYHTNSMPMIVIHQHTQHVHHTLTATCAASDFIQCLKSATDQIQQTSADKLSVNYTGIN